MPLHPCVDAPTKVLNSWDQAASRPRAGPRSPSGCRQPARPSPPSRSVDHGRANPSPRLESAVRARRRRLCRGGFTDAFVITRGGPNHATLFLALYLYNHAFKYLNMGYAAAIAWVMFIIVMLLTLLVFRSSALWVFYERERQGKSA